MRRREFITLLGGAAAWPLIARAQVPAMPTIGVLGTASALAWSKSTDAFVQRLRALGWIEGRTVAIEYRWAEGRSERFAEIAAEFVRLKVDVIMTWSGGPVIAAKQATTVIPIIFALQTDPVGTGLVASLSRPGGNVTGLSVQQTDTVSKRLGLLREVVPGISRLAVLFNAANPAPGLDMREVQGVARKLGLEVVLAEVRRTEDITSVVEALKGRADALYVAIDPLLNTSRTRI